MKKSKWMISGCIIVVLLLSLAGCSGGSSQTSATTPATQTTVKATENPTQKPTEKPTEKPTQKPTETPTETPTQKPTEKPTQKPTEPPTENVSEKIKEELTAQKWGLTKCIVDGKETSPAYQYGHFISQTGAYMEFKNDYTFSCVMGFISCEGTYDINDDEVSVHITGEADGSNISMVPTDKYETLDCDFDSGIIKLDYCKGDYAKIINIFEKL
ncbi:hypothetical protein SAMN02910436_00528 [Ruminococcaceae bacterium P7]|nr:hypothetical protein SAMN02910436_00528 [Ruminococcaceae bacterium P7]